MTTITFKINEKSKAGKTFMQMKETFFANAKGIESIENSIKKTNKITKKEAFINDLKMIGKDCQDIKNGTSNKKFQSIQTFLDGI